MLVLELGMHNGQYPAWSTSAEWDEVLLIKQEVDDCERYHCLPSQLDGEDYHRLQLHRAIRAAEAQYVETDRKLRAGRGRRGR